MERKPTQLLVVEDNYELCDILEGFFDITPEVHVCGIAHDGEEGLVQIKKLQPDVVLLDLIMPKLDGLSMLEKLNDIDLIRKPIVIVASANGQELMVSKAVALGASFYMAKPYNLSELLKRVCLVATKEPQYES